MHELRPFLKSFSQDFIFLRSRPLSCPFNSQIYPRSVWWINKAPQMENSSLDEARGLHVSRDYPLDRGKDRQIFVRSYFLVFGRGKSLILLASSVNSSIVLRELCCIKKNYILPIFLLDTSSCWLSKRGMGCGHPVAYAVFCPASRANQLTCMWQIINSSSVFPCDAKSHH